jgi:hypothetical protein
MTKTEKFTAAKKLQPFVKNYNIFLLTLRQPFMAFKPPALKT